MLSTTLLGYKETSHNVICTLIRSWNNFQGVSLQTVKGKNLNCLTKDKKLRRANDHLLCDLAQLLPEFKKVPSHCPRQVDFPAGQVTFHSHLPDGQGIRRVVYQLNH